MDGGLINPNPVIHERRARPATTQISHASNAVGPTDEASRERIDASEIFDHVRDIIDPEHPYTLEQLHVVSEEAIDCDDERGRVKVQFTPTVQHCSMATVIGLCIRVQLLRSLPSRFKVDIMLAPGSHSSEEQVNKQLNDKERVAAALENPNLLDMVDRCLAGPQDE